MLGIPLTSIQDIYGAFLGCPCVIWGTPRAANAPVLSSSDWHALQTQPLALEQGELGAGRRVTTPTFSVTHRLRHTSYLELQACTPAAPLPKSHGLTTPLDTSILSYPNQWNSSARPKQCHPVPSQKLIRNEKLLQGGDILPPFLIIPLPTLPITSHCAILVDPWHKHSIFLDLEAQNLDRHMGAFGNTFSKLQYKWLVNSFIISLVPSANKVWCLCKQPKAEAVHCPQVQWDQELHCTPIAYDCQWFEQGVCFTVQQTPPLPQA